MEIHCQEESDSTDHKKTKASERKSQNSHMVLLFPHKLTKKPRQGNSQGHSLFCLGLCKPGLLKTPFAFTEHTSLGVNENRVLLSGLALWDNMNLRKSKGNQ